ncbi:MAG: hypothetical protein K2J37_00655 [Ruminococcus sp.]|nr:hypothetical protein [Ruminococcus sp.]MDE6784071.1 hypothetical protein [Ruminococcus sp.]
MKKFFLILSLICTASVITGCGQEKNPSEYIKTENFTIFSSVAYPEVEMVNADSGTVSAESVAFSYSLNGTSVELYINNQFIRAVECNYNPNADYIIIEDFNCDGFKDIFIPFENERNYGEYYCYLPESNDFQKNKYLSDIGQIMTVSDNMMLTQDMSDTMIERYIYYQWDGDVLHTIRKTETYVISVDGEKHTDIYVYDENGTPHLTVDSGNE